MRFRDILIPFMTGALIFGLNVFNSCASTGVTDETSEMTVPDGTKGPFGESGAAVAGAQSDELMALGEIPTDGEKKAKEAKAVKLSGKTKSAELPPVKAASENTGSYLPAPETPLAPPVAEVPQQPTAPATPVNQPPPADMGTLAAADQPPLPPPPPIVSENPGTLPGAPRSGGIGSSRVPKIPSEAIHKKGAMLNRFYFTRNGDTPKKVATLLYGDKKKSKSLMKWNGAGWAPGKLVYYQSATQPEDAQMRSFYQDRNVPTEEYEVKKGDWLSRIANKRLGNVRSWKEIAVTNGIEKPTKIEPGQKLAMFPKDLTPYGSAPGEAPPPQQVAGNTPGNNTPGGRGNEPPTTRATPPPVAKAQAPTAPAVEVPGGGEETPPMAAAQGLPDPAANPTPESPGFIKNKKKQKTAGFDLMQFLDQNLLFGVVFVILAVLLGALLVVNKRKKAAGEDFAEEGFSTKARRR